MEKKYSVEMENGEVISIEVDGIAYADPDEIFDEQDRAKIKKLIAHTADESSERDLEKEFAEELREMQNGPRVFRRLFMAIFLGVAFISLAGAVFSTIATIKTLAREVSAPGKVVNMVTRTSTNSETENVTRYFYPVIEFVPGAGQRSQQVEIPEGSTSPGYAVGDEVTVLYDPQQPRNARIKSWASNLLLWLLPIISFLVGISFAAVVAFMFRIWPFNRKTAHTADLFQFG